MTPFYQDDLITLYNCRCEDFMAECAYKQFELAIVDPPYGIGEDGHRRTRKKHNYSVIHIKKDWDEQRPNIDYFNELWRISENQIIWGANYFVEMLCPSMGWVVWNKLIGGDFSDCELAFTSFDRALKMFTYWNGNNGIPRIHPTQKPVALYRWLLQNYAKPGWTIFDSHSGSCSLAIACHDLGFKLTACELDLDYLTAAVNRIKNYLKQPKWFKPSAPVAEQTKLF